MSQDTEAKLRAQIEAIRSDRDAALLAVEHHERDAEAQTRLLVEEQDRFVSRLLEEHEREIGKLRLELDEARTVAEQSLQRGLRDRAAVSAIEEQLAHTRADVDRLRQQRDATRAELRRVQQAADGAPAVIERLQAELSMARSMLDDAMRGERKPGTWQTAEPPAAAHETARSARQSGIVSRGRVRSNSPPPRVRDAFRRSETPRAAVAGGGRPTSSGPPSSR